MFYMAKKIIINESQLERLILSESNVDDLLKSRELEKKIKDVAGNAIKNDKELEKKIKQIVGKTIKELFKTLWQRNMFWENV